MPGVTPNERLAREGTDRASAEGLREDPVHVRDMPPDIRAVRDSLLMIGDYGVMAKVVARQLREHGWEYVPDTGPRPDSGIDATALAEALSDFRREREQHATAPWATDEAVDYIMAALRDTGPRPESGMPTPAGTSAEYDTTPLVTTPDRADRASAEGLRAAAEKVLDAWDHQGTEAACWAVHMDLRAALRSSGTDATPDRADPTRLLVPDDVRRLPIMTDRASAEGLRTYEEGAFVKVLRQYADIAHDNETYRVMVTETLLRDAIAVIEDLGRAALRDTGPRPDSGIDAAYRERNAVVAALIRSNGYRAEVVMAPDTEGWFIVYADTPAGQVSWHISPDDMDLFSDWPVAFGSHHSPWDGHDTDEKYRRVARLSTPRTETSEP